MEMLKDRGYIVTDDEINMTRQQFVEKYGEDVRRQDLFMHKAKRDNSSDQIFVFFLAPEPKKLDVGVSPIKNCFEKMSSDRVLRAILVAPHGFTPSAKKSFTDIPRFTLESFRDAELLCNVMQHDLVPEHRVLTDEEKSALLQKYGVKETQLPRMLMIDPIARYFGLKRGQVVKIIRPSENASKYITYRYVS